MRVGLITVPGIAIPYPYGGKQRLVSIDLDLRKLQEKNLTQSDVTNAVNAQALVFPSGTVKLGPKQYQVDVNTFPLRIDSLNELPIKTIDGATIRVKDVAQVRDGYDPQTNIVRQDGVRSVLMVLLKNGSASTLSVVSGAKQAMANVLKTVNSAVRVKEFSDQSVFVRAAISGVVREGVIAGSVDRSNDSSFSRFVEKHHHRRDLDSPFGSCLARGAKRLGRNNQPDDTWRACAGRRDSGR